MAFQSGVQNVTQSFILPSKQLLSKSVNDTKVFLLQQSYDCFVLHLLGLYKRYNIQYEALQKTNAVKEN